MIFSNFYLSVIFFYNYNDYMYQLHECVHMYTSYQLPATRYIRVMPTTVWVVPSRPTTVWVVPSRRWRLCIYRFTTVIFFMHIYRVHVCTVL